jgi:hypothetical protein
MSEPDKRPVINHYHVFAGWFDWLKHFPARSPVYKLIAIGLLVVPLTLLALALALRWSGPLVQYLGESERAEREQRAALYGLKKPQLPEAEGERLKLTPRDDRIVAR